MADGDFDLFWRTHLVTSSNDDSDCQFPETTVVYWSVTKEEPSQFPWTRREGTSRCQATTAVARELLTQIRVVTSKKVVMSVTLIQNYSPTSDCVQELLKVVSLAAEKKIKMNISLTFVGLHKISRPSWAWRGFHRAVSHVTLNESNDNCLGLKLLQQAGIKLFTFSPQTWKFLYTFLGHGLPSEIPGKFLASKYSGANAEVRAEEDRLTENDFKVLMKGMVLTSPSLSLEPSTCALSWSPPAIKTTSPIEYGIHAYKVTVKNGEADDKSWRILSVTNQISTVTSLSGARTTYTLSDLDRDAFYDVTVEASVRGMVLCGARKVFKTSDRASMAPAPSPATSRRNVSRVGLVSSPRPASTIDISTNGVDSLTIEGSMRPRGLRQTAMNGKSVRASTDSLNSAVDSSNSPRTGGGGTTLRRSISALSAPRPSTPVSAGLSRHGSLRRSTSSVTSRPK